MKFSRIAFVAAEVAAAQEAMRHLSYQYTSSPPEQADVIVALGGDGFILEILHHYIDSKIPIYGMNCGDVGFLLNIYSDQFLLERLERAEAVRLHPLIARMQTIDGQFHKALAINEVSLLRETRQTAKIRITVDDRVRLEELVCDGILVSTPAGSTAYNLSVHGPIIPMGSGILALTSISAFRPRRWRGALLPHDARVGFEILDSGKRPVSAVADYKEVRDVVRVDVYEDDDTCLKLLFDPEHSLEERVLSEQFVT